MGIDIDRVIVARMLSGPPEAGNSRWNADFEAAAERIAGLGGVLRTGLASSVPFVANSMARVIAAPGQNSLERLPDSMTYISGASASYFSALGIPLLAGTIDSAWSRGAARNAVAVNETFARAVWPNGGAIGKCLQLYGAGPSCRNVAARKSVSGLHSALAHRSWCA